MKTISIFTTITDPEKRQDPYLEAIENYLDFADEVVIIDGTPKKKRGEYLEKILQLPQATQKIKIGFNTWKQEFSWDFIGRQFELGYNACESDVAIRMDIDYFLHEDDFEYIRLFLEDCEAPAAMFVKRQFILTDRFGVKSWLPIVFNKKKFGDRIKLDAGGDLCQPSLDGEELDKDKLPLIKKREYLIVGEDVSEEQIKKRVPPEVYKEGNSAYSHDTGIPIYNYDFLLKTKEVIKKDFGRFARAWTKTFNNRTLGGPDDESAFKLFMRMQLGRLKKGSFETLPIESYPKYIQDKIKNLKPEQFGYNCFNKVKKKEDGSLEVDI